MIPVKEGIYSIVDLVAKQKDTTEERNYKNLLNKEFSFCLKILPSIIQKANKLYNKQIETGKIIKFCCDFKLIEEKCDQYKV